MSFKRDKITEVEKLETLRLSPSSINTFNKCNRRWFFEYVEAKQSPPSIHLERGNAVHETLENLFKQKSFSSGEQFRIKMLKTGQDLLDIAWANTVGTNLPDIDKKTNDTFYKESIFMVERFINKFCDNIQAGIDSGEFSSERQGFYFLRPVFKEFWIDDEYEVDDKNRKLKDEDGNYIPKKDCLHVGGFIDAVNKNFDGGKILVDYKTSKKYKNALSEEYVLQLAIYAYLWKMRYGYLPEYVAINYLKYDESFYIQVTPSLVRLAINHIKAMRANLIDNGLDQRNYPAKFSNLCNWCPFQNECAEIEEKLKEEEKQ